MSKIIIVCGPDRVGKNSIIEEIRREFLEDKFHLMHYTKVPSGATIHYSKNLYKEMFQGMRDSFVSGRSLMLNRSHLGEMVYGPKYRGYDGEYVLEIESEFFSNHPRVANEIRLITMLGSEHDLFEREDGKSQARNIDDIREELGLFEKAHGSTKIKHKFLLQTSGLTVKEAREKAVSFLKTSYEHR